MQLNPKLQIELSFEDRYVDLVEQGVDIAIRIWRLADSTSGPKNYFSSDGGKRRTFMQWFW